MPSISGIVFKKIYICISILELALVVFISEANLSLESIKSLQNITSKLYSIRSIACQANFIL